MLSAQGPLLLFTSMIMYLLGDCGYQDVELTVLELKRLSMTHGVDRNVYFDQREVRFHD